MYIKRTATWVFAIITFGVVAFQLALAAGAPWGEYAMGGAYPGQFPPALRAGALVQALLLAGFGAVIAARGGLIATSRPGLVRVLAWVVVAFSAISFVLNSITPSAGERTIWAPITLAMLICSLIVASNFFGRHSL